jgi:peptidoglycan/xylan/chitin deacetylase (PgdA/CDA1 family)
MNPLKVAAHLLSPAGGRARLSVLIFHRVVPEPDPLFPGEVDARRFDQILKCVGAIFNVLPLDVTVDCLARGDLPARALAITFDDGYADNHDVALPILQKHGMNATFFVASDFVDGGRMWNDTVIESVRRFGGSDLDLSAIGLGRFSMQTVADRCAAIDSLLGQLKYRPAAERTALVESVAAVAQVSLPNDLMMSSAQIRALRAAGMIIGGHTASHPILARLSDEDAFDEIAAGKRRLESILDERIAFFAYPNGKPGRDYLASHATMVARAGFSAAVTTAAGVARSGCDPFQIPRFTPWDRSKWRFGLRMLRNMRTGVALAPGTSDSIGEFA